MSEQTEIFNEMKEAGMEKRRQNTITSTATLRSQGFAFEVKNGGAHIIIGTYGKTYKEKIDFDFWPSTGLFINRTTGKKGRGVFNLIRELRK